MTWFPDLAPCTYFGHEPATLLRSVGWLEPDQPYSTGSSANPFVARLVELLRRPWQPVMCMGWQACGFCCTCPRSQACTCPGCSSDPTSHCRCMPPAYSFAGSSVSLGVSNVFVPGDGVIYAAPSLVLHYMDAHDYRPPKAFRAAVMACPPMDSDAYFQAVRKQELEDLFHETYRRAVREGRAH